MFKKNTLRGLHFQHPSEQGKLISVLQGSVFDVAVDIRQNSPTFGKWIGFQLSDKKPHQLFIPPGFAHGFVVLSDLAYFFYKCTDYYHAEAAKTIAWNDPDLAIGWPITNPILSEKDATAPKLSSFLPENLPRY